MDKILIKMDYCWADEFDIECLWATTIQEFEDFKSKLSKLDISDDVEIYFGTNEWISFTSYEDIMDSLEVIYVPNTFHSIFTEYIGETFGLISIPDLLEHYNTLEDE